MCAILLLTRCFAFSLSFLKGPGEETRSGSHFGKEGFSPWILTQPHFAGEGQMVATGHVTPLPILSPRQAHTVLPVEEVAVRLPVMPVLVQLPEQAEKERGQPLRSGLLVRARLAKGRGLPGCSAQAGREGGRDGLFLFPASNSWAAMRHHALWGKPFFLKSAPFYPDSTASFSGQGSCMSLAFCLVC